MKLNPMEIPNINQPMNIDMFKQFLPKISNQEFEQMKQMAQKMGMNQQQIDEGMRFLNQFR